MHAEGPRRPLPDGQRAGPRAEGLPRRSHPGGQQRHGIRGPGGRPDGAGDRTPGFEHLEHATRKHDGAAHGHGTHEATDGHREGPQGRGGAQAQT